MPLIEQGALTDAEKAGVEDLFGPANLRELLAVRARMKRDRQPGRLGIYAHLNGRGEVILNEKHAPPALDRRNTA